MKVEDGAPGKVTMKDSAAKPSRGILTAGNFQMSETHCARQSCAEEMKSSSSKLNIYDKRRRKFLVDHENSRSNRMKQEAASEIVKELLNLSQSELSEKEHSSRVFLQMDLIAENRSNRDQLVASECELNAERLNIWKDVEVTREIEWVVKHRILAQLGNFRDLEESRKAANDERSVLASNATLLRVKQLNNWLKSCNSLGLYPPSDDISLDFLASAKRDTEVISDLNDLKISTEEGVELSRAHSIFLSDAEIMYASPLLIPKPLPKVEDLHLFEDLPYTISEHLSQVDVKWLLSEVLETQDMMPTADPSACINDKFQYKDRSLEGIWSRKVSFAKNIDYSLTSSPPTNNLVETIVPVAHILDGIKDFWGSDYRYAIAEHLAVHDFDNYVLDIGNTSTDVDNDKLLPNLAPSASEIPAIIPLTHQPKRRGSVVSAEVEDVCPSPEHVVQAPSWLLTTPAKHLLGAVIVAVRCAAAATTTATAAATTAAAAAAATTTTAAAATTTTATTTTAAAAVTAAPMIVAAAPRVVDNSKLDINVEQMNTQACDESSVAVTATDADFTYQAESADPESMAPSMTLAQHSSCALNSVEKSVPVLSVRLALCGACDFAKREISNAISVLSGGGVRVISVDRLLSQAVARAREIASDSTKSYQTALSEDSEDSSGYEYGDEQHLGVRALKILLAGKCIPDDIYVSLLINAINELEADMRERALYSTGDRTAAQGDAVTVTGYILEDFPNTKQQASLLVTALSGVDYDSHKPQPADHASRFAPIAPHKISVHDNALCGLDKVLYLDATMESSLSEILSARKNTVTNEVIHFPFGDQKCPMDLSYMASNITHGNANNSNQLNLIDLEEINDSSSSRHTSFFDIALSASAGEDLKAFLSKLGVSTELHSEDYTTREEYINAAIEVLYQPAGACSVVVTDQSRVNDVTSCNPDLKLYGLMDTDNKSEDNTPHEDESKSQKETAAVTPIECSNIPLPVPPKSYTSLPPQLATALSGMWNAAENHSIIVGRMFFKTLRDHRYQMIQRRRVMYDSLRLLQVRLDNRQDLFEDFIVGFNQIDDDFRFDTDCVAELHLRTLELRELILSGCDVRRKDAESFVSTVSLDGIHHLLLHMSECEGAAMIQAEYNRFVVSMHLILDYSKSMASYDRTKRILNLLEETLQASVLDDSSTSSIAAKDGRKSNPSATSSTGPGSGTGSSAGVITKKQQPVRKGSQNQTLLEPEIYRVPVPVISLPFGAMSEHLRQVALADTVDDDARTVTTKSHSHRGKTDIKQSRIRPSSSATTREEKLNKTSSGANQSTGSVSGTGAGSGQGSVPLSGVFHLMECAVLDLAMPWSKDNFKINTVLYDKDRSLCSALEAGVWHECVRFKTSVESIKRILRRQAAWLQDTEATLLSLLEKKIIERYEKECSSAERLIGMIEEKIESAQSIRCQWLLAPDVIAVVKNVLLTSPEPSIIIPIIERCDNDKLNEIQMNALEVWINSVALGGFILEEDLHSLLDRGLSVIGPFGTKTLHSEGVLEHLTFPRKWRDLEYSSSTSSSNSLLKSIKQPSINTGKHSSHFEGIRKFVVKREKVNGIDEYTGSMSVDSILNILRGKFPLS